MCLQVKKQFVCSPTTPRLVREYVDAELGWNSVDLELDVVGDTALIVSELVTNSLRAGADAVTVRLTLHRDHLRVAVGDRANGLPVARSRSTTNPRGRGLFLVEQLSSSWGVLADDVGKQVWAVLPVPAELTTDLPCTVLDAVSVADAAKFRTARSAAGR